MELIKKSKKSVVKKSVVAKKSATKKLSSLGKVLKKHVVVSKTPAVEVPKVTSITKAFPDKGMAQIYSSGLEFAFVSPEGEQCHPFAYCKDFLQDAVQATLHKRAGAIYGFEYAYGKNPALDLNNTRMSVRYKKRATLGDEVQNSLVFLNEIEKELGFSPSTVHDGGEHAGTATYVFISDKRWQLSPPLISMYSLMIRVGLNYKGGGWVKHLESGSFIGSNDKHYIQSAIKGIKKIVEKKVENIFADAIEDNYPASVGIGSMHGSSGIVCYSNGMSGDLVKNWKSK